MPGEAEERGEAHKDETATEPPADVLPGSEHGDSEESGGPYGDPASNEETLRKQQEERRQRREDE
jgi:hypothetical protein